MTGLLAALVTGCALTNWQPLVTSHLSRYPAMELVDAMKLLHQATMGSEHWVLEDAAAAWMDREWASLGPGPDEPLVDTLGANGRYARINLRPYRAAGGAPGPLVGAFVAAGREAPPDSAALSCALEALAELARRGQVPWSADSVSAVIVRWRQEGFPALRHSELYRRAQAPAYRVVPVSRVESLLEGLRPR